MNIFVHKQIDKIDPLWFRDSGRVDVSEETKINGTGEEVKAYYASGVYLLTSLQHLSQPSMQLQQ
jgi:hypothetical protein